MWADEQIGSSALEMLNARPTEGGSTWKEGPMTYRKEQRQRGLLSFHHGRARNKELLLPRERRQANM